jgi:hypothetical protein
MNASRRTSAEPLCEWEATGWLSPNRTHIVVRDATALLLARLAELERELR